MRRRRYKIVASRLTFDAVAIQAAIAPNESLPLHTVALRAFCSDKDVPDKIAVLRARRACQVLKERGLVEIREGYNGAGWIVRSLAPEGQAAVQLQAIMARTIISVGPTEPEAAVDE
jgi:hypothetical protein